MEYINIDAKFITNGTGIGNDTRMILDSFVNLGFELNLLQIERRHINDLKFILSLPTVNRNIDWKKGVNFFPQFSGLIPPQNNNLSIWRVHDLFPISNPEWFTLRSQILFKKTLKASLRQDSYYLCNSKFTSKILSKHFEIPSKRIEILECASELSVDSVRCFQCEACEITFKEPYFLSVGTIEPRKNYPYLISNWKKSLIKDTHYLYIVGKYGWKQKNIMKELKNSQKFNVIYLDYVCAGSLKILYENCDALISTSFDEGFNIPAHEARKFDKPLILSDTEVHRELHRNDNNLLFNLREKSRLTQLLDEHKCVDSRKENVKHEIGSQSEILSDILMKWGILNNA